MQSKYSEIVNIFQDEELRNLMAELLEANEGISQREPVTGFNHSYYVPGWIGIIQTSIVQSKMNKFSKLPFYKDKNYLEFANWFSGTSKNAVELLINSKDKFETDDELYRSQCNVLTGIYMTLFNNWIRCSPEVATFYSYEHNRMLYSAAGLIHTILSPNLSKIGFNEKESEKKQDSSFTQEAKGMLYNLAGYIINVILFACIIGLGSLIFG